MPILPLLVIIGLYALNQIAQQSIRQMLLAFISLIAVMDTVKFMSESAWDRAPESIPLAFAKSVYNPILQDFNLSETDFPWFELISREYLSHLPARVMLDK
ncbi:MAG: hypothetical protein SVR94_01735, partial [Pseudomonadota bacterium]|nr:hypothetical protein [Pseudomonadota bacterium]